MPPQARAALPDWFAELAGSGELSHGYLLVSQDSVRLGDVGRAVLRAVDGAHRAQLADGLVVAAEEGSSSIGIATVTERVRPHLLSHPAVAPYRTALVLDAERLTPEAQNALLKVAEEPPSRAALFLAAADEERILPTLRSRLQRVAVPKLSDAEVATWLREECGADADAAARIAAQSGGMLSLAAEQIGETPARTFAQQLLASPAAGVPSIAKEAAMAEVSLQALLRALSVELAYTARTPRSRELWHRTQRLAAQAQSSPLNLRLQVAALFTDLPAHD